ncbi:MAG: exopolysaccharide biosynthesis polyprenyl glycosylphosphotransferase [Leadbetterella sp.]|nr:exopolysaccharide biosynthesis polyprenyl glycosylphosphotransferase [Leadbetterella sp.]
MKKYRLSFLFGPIAFLLNIVTLNVSVIGSYYLKFHNVESLFEPPYIILFWFLNLAWVAILGVFKPTKNSRISFNIPTLIFNYTKIIIFLLLIVSLFWVSYKSYFYSRQVLFYTILFTVLIGYFWRIIAVFALKAYRSSGHNGRSFAILGDGDLSKQIQSYYAQSPELGFKNLGTYVADSQHGKNIENLFELCMDKTVDIVYACPPYIGNDNIQNLIKLSENYPFEVKIISDFRGFFDRGLSVEYHGYIPVLNVSKKPYSDPKVELVKRIFDLSVSTIIILTLFPVLLIISLITIISSRGPLFYTQERIGRWSKPFKIIKFRSMYLNSEKNGPQLSTGNLDPRITPWGRIMRKTRLDELPQFFNVIMGDMSVVGPRPERQHFIDQIVEIAPEFNKLLTLRPGITSIGQVKYGYASTVAEMVNRMKYDLIYLKKYSIETDLQIIFLTVTVMIQGRGK